MVQNGSKPFPGPQRMFFDTPTCTEQISRNFSKVEISTSKWIFSCCIALQSYTSVKKRVFNITSEPNLSLDFQFFAKRCQGSEVWDQIKLLVERIFDTMFIFWKNRFWGTLTAKMLPKQARILWKILEKISKNVKKCQKLFFFEILSDAF